MCVELSVLTKKKNCIKRKNKSRKVFPRPAGRRSRFKPYAKDVSKEVGRRKRTRSSSKDPDKSSAEGYTDEEYFTSEIKEGKDVEMEVTKNTKGLDLKLDELSDLDISEIMGIPMIATESSAAFGDKETRGRRTR